MKVRFRNLTLVSATQASRPPKHSDRGLNCMIEDIEENVLLNFYLFFSNFE